MFGCPTGHLHRSASSYGETILLPYVSISISEHDCYRGVVNDSGLSFGVWTEEAMVSKEGAEDLGNDEVEGSSFKSGLAAIYDSSHT